MTVQIWFFALSHVRCREYPYFDCFPATFVTIQIINTIKSIGLNMTRQTNPNTVPMIPNVIPRTAPTKLNRLETIKTPRKTIRIILNASLILLFYLSISIFFTLEYFSITAYHTLASSVLIYS